MMHDTPGMNQVIDPIVNPTTHQHARTNRRRRCWAVLAGTTAIAGLVTVSALVGAASPHGDGEVFSDARIIIEYNATAQDVGMQMFIDGEPWKLLRVYDPRNRKVLEIKGTNSIGRQGLTELFFESSEPPLGEFSFQQFFQRFPAGVYDLEGITVDGLEIEGEAVFTHRVPAPPVVVSPQEGSVQDPDNTVVDWNPVPNPSGSVIESYQVIITQLDIDVLPKRLFSVHLPASVTSVTVPAEFMRPNAEYDFEVLAIESGGNQTISTGEFSTSS